MGRYEAPPFARGETYYNGGTIDSTNLGGVNLEGREYEFEVNSAAQESGYAVGVGQDISGRGVRVKVVRNRSGAALKAARVVKYDTTVTTYPYQTGVIGYCYALADLPAGVVDEFLPSAGVPANDLFYIVVDGPTKVTNSHTNVNVTAAGVFLVPSAADSPGSATDNLGGRIALQDLTGSQATLAENIQNVIAVSAEANNTADATFKAIVRRAYKG